MNDYISFVLGVLTSLVGVYLTFFLQSKTENRKRDEELLRFVLNPISQRLDRLIDVVGLLEDQDLNEKQLIFNFLLNDWNAIESLFYQYIHTMDNELKDGFENLRECSLDIAVSIYAKEYANDADTYLDSNFDKWQSDVQENARNFKEIIDIKREVLVKLE
ncbi:MAG: hypothetical protein CVU90_13865 [Firmicutes bacterium HGW-Firmicutes-15]|nr:MAG: hypothetical protein CVU90_13865 [Firmicutes bacterium HGW-Firmicutes-15]